MFFFFTNSSVWFLNNKEKKNEEEIVIMHPLSVEILWKFTCNYIVTISHELFLLPFGFITQCNKIPFFNLFVFFPSFFFQGNICLIIVSHRLSYSFIRNVSPSFSCSLKIRIIEDAFIDISLNRLGKPSLNNSFFECKHYWILSLFFFAFFTFVALLFVVDSIIIGFFFCSKYLFKWAIIQTSSIFFSLSLKIREEKKLISFLLFELKWSATCKYP